MKICITFPRCDQVGPDDFKTWDAVVHINPDETMREVANKMLRMQVKDCQLHIEETENKQVG